MLLHSCLMRVGGEETGIQLLGLEGLLGLPLLHPALPPCCVTFSPRYLMILAICGSIATFVMEARSLEIDSAKDQVERPSFRANMSGRRLNPLDAG